MKRRHHQDSKDHWNWTHTDREGKFHRVVRADRGHESFDRWAIHVDGIVVYFGPDQDAAEKTWAHYRTILAGT